MKKKLLFFIGAFLALAACEDVFEPNVRNNRDLASLRGEPEVAMGLLYNGYTRLPTNGWSFSEMATDDAVATIAGNNFTRMATGQWAANFNPVSQWANSRAAIQYINLMLSEVDKTVYAADSLVNRMFRERTKGEAHGLRAIFMYHLLQAHGGEANGEFLGVPIVLEPEDPNTDFAANPRATFEACMQQLYDDIELAIEYLPLDFEDLPEGAIADVPAKYRELGASVDVYNRVFGESMRLRVTERIIRAIRAKAALMAASPAFSAGNTTTWEDAAHYAAEVIDLRGGLSLAANGVTWYANNQQINDLGSGVNPPEFIWRANVENNATGLEQQNFPPTLFGNGLVNPTQNLVDAFPMANGYPISDQSSGYNPNNPYAGRDPRLNQFIVVNNSTAGHNNSTILTQLDGGPDGNGTQDGLNKVEISTRTGYYMRKLLRQDVNLTPGNVNGQRHLKPHIRYTEIFLSYAEAANEAWGPTANGGHAYSAYDVIKAIRVRAGVGTTNNDPYLESIKNDQAAMRQLIRNERRLELSFEGFRFWDLRRWKANLNETAKGVRIEGGIHEIIDVEPRNYADFMIYGPVPNNEILKYGFRQNTGW